MLEVIPLQIQDLVFPFAELHEVPFGPFLLPVWVPLDGSTTISGLTMPLSFVSSAKLQKERKIDVYSKQ